VALDGRYRWEIKEDAGVLDAMDRPRTIAVGVENGRVILQISSASGGWVSLPEGIASQLAFYLEAADDAVGASKRRGS
jgi:hypothetical protein